MGLEDVVLDGVAGFGEHHLYTKYSWEWLIKFRNPFGEMGQIRVEPTFLSNELEFYMLGLLTFIHAYRHGGRYLWFSFFGQREPGHIIMLYPGFVYTASVAVYRLGLTELSGACAVALFVLIFDMPYDIVGVKLLWWTWHDTDANIRDRMYWVPWTSYYFHLTFACAFDLIYQRARRYFVGITGLYSADDIQKMPYAQQRLAANWRGELKALTVTGLFSMPFGICQFVPGYHWFKDVFAIHAEVTTCILGSIYALVLFYGLQRCKPVDTKEVGEREIMRGDKKSGKGRWYYDEIYLAMCMHYIHYCVLVVFANPKSYQVLGLHQPMGSPPGTGDEFDCSHMRNLSYPYPFTPSAFPPFLKTDLFDVTVWKRPYLCPGGEMLDEKYFDFSCPKAQAQPWTPGNQWFYVCGTDWEDGSGLTHIEYILVVWGICFVGFNLYTQALCYPRNAWDQLFVLKEFPKYYKTGVPDTVVTKVIDDRIGAEGEQEFKVTRASYDGLNEETRWEKRTELVQDCAGPVYGEREGLYGMMFDTYGGSSRDRVRVYDSYKHSMERLALFEKQKKRGFAVGISYEGAVPRAAGLAEGEAESGGSEVKQRRGRSKKTAATSKRGRTPTRK